MKKLVFLVLFLVSGVGTLYLAQQPQYQGSVVYNANSKTVQGVGPGYWPTAGSGLTLNLTGGTAYCSPSITTYPGGTLTMANNATNYVYLSGCTPGSNTTGFTSTTIPVATVVTGGGLIISIADDRTHFVAGGVINQVNGLIWNVKTNGAVGNGSTDDTAAVNTTIAQCNASGGTLFFPAGSYLLSSTTTAITNFGCNVQGQGKASTLEAANGTSGISLLKIADSPRYDGGQHNQFIRDLTYNCNSSNPSVGSGRQNTGEWLLDSLMVEHQNLSFYNCSTDILMENSALFEERNSFLDITLENFNAGFMLQQDAADPYPSFEHNAWKNIYFNTYANGDKVFHLYGTTYPPQLNSSILENLNGNYSPASGTTYLFYLDGGGTLQYDFITTSAETDSGTSYAFFGGTSSTITNSCGQMTPCVTDNSGYVTPTVTSIYGGTAGIVDWNAFNPVQWWTGSELINNSTTITGAKALGPAAYHTNLEYSSVIENGTPDLGAAGSVPPGWWASGLGASVALVSDTDPGGNSSQLVVKGTSVASYAAVNTTVFGVVPGEVYQVTGWYKTGGAGTWVFYFRDGSGSNQAMPGAGQHPSSWTAFNFVYTIPSGGCTLSNLTQPGCNNAYLAFANASGTSDLVELYGVTCRPLHAVGKSHTPATSTEACTQGMVDYDTTYVYVCVAANTWERTALSTF